MFKLKTTTPFVLGTTIDANGKSRKIYPPYLSIAGKQNGQAFVLWLQDEDRVVRRFKDNLGSSDNPMNPLVKTMAKQLGHEAQSGLINYTQGKAIQYIAIQEVLNWYKNNNSQKLKHYFSNKAVIIGTVLPFEDRHYQPVNLAAWESNNDNYVPGVLLHVQALRNALNNGFIQQVPTIVLVLLNALIAFFWFAGKTLYKAIFLLFIPLILLIISQYVLLQNLIYFPISSALAALFIILSGRQLYESIVQILERQRLKKSFSGYVSPHVMEEILKGSIKPDIYGDRENICILFSDIRSFTSISEKMEPEDIIRFLNKYLGAMTEAIQSHDGTIDKFMGDGIMAFFGAPKNSSAPVLDAFNAAKDKLKKLEDLNQEFAETNNMPFLKIGIGLHYGAAVVGNIGSKQRNEYTAIGDVVNTASRLEGLTKLKGYPIIVSDVVAKILQKEAVFDDLGKIPVKGRADVNVFGWPAKNQIKESNNE